MRLSKIFYIILIFILSSCAYKRSSSDFIFENEYTVEGAQILSEEFSINQLFAINNYLFGYQKTGQYFFKIYNIETLSEIGEICKRGKGPNEFPSFLILNQYETCGIDLCIWVHDLNVGKLTKVNVKESLEKGETVVLNEIATKSQSSFFNAFVIDSSLVVGRSTNSIIDMNRLQLYNPINDSIIRTIPLFPKIDVTRSNDDINFRMVKYNPLYVGSIGLKPDKTKIASAMTSFNRIDIFDVNGDLYKSIVEGPEIPEYLKNYLNSDEDNSESTLQYFYSSIFTSNNFIYALYIGQMLSEYGGKSIPTQLRIFDWEGNPLVRININDYLFSFTIDENRGLLFGVDYYNEKLLRYDIKRIIEKLK